MYLNDLVDHKINPRRLVLQTGGSGKLYCNSDTKTVTWRHNGKTLQNKNRILHFYEFNRSMKGLYECEGYSKSGGGVFYANGIIIHYSKFLISFLLMLAILHV